MRTLAKFADARGTTQGKIVAVFLSVVLAFSFLNAFGWNDSALANETDGDTTTTIVDENDESGEPSLTVQSNSEETTIVEDDTTPSETTTTTIGTAEDPEPEPASPYVFDETTGTLTITDAGVVSQASVESNLKKMGVEKNSVKSLSINGCDSVAALAFYSTNYSYLETVEIKNTKEICENAFFKSPKLQTVVISDVTALSENSSGFSKAFAECGKLSSVTLKNVKYIGREAFRSCFDLNNLQMEGVEEIGWSAFSFCTGLKELSLDANIQGVKKIDMQAFFGCSGLTKVSIKNVDTIGTQAFYGCTGLKEADISNAESICTQAFMNCTNMESLTISDMETLGGDEINLLVNCPNLITLVLTNIGTIAEKAFLSNPFITKVEIRNVGTIGKNAFASCKKITDLTISGVKTIEMFAFYNCLGLTEIDSLDDVDQINGFAFMGCKNITSMNVETLNKMGFVGVYESIMARVQAILAGKFQLDDAKKVGVLTEDRTNWEVSEVGRSTNWQSYDNGTQIREQARWDADSEIPQTVAQVEVNAYYTGKQQMDYIFVADLSGSMAQLGNADDDNARFYDMQSKLLDMSDQLLTAPGYECQVAIVTFGGAFNNNSTCKNSQFITDAAVASDYIKGLSPLNENTDYGLGMQEAQKLVEANQGRNTVVVFLSDGAPNVGESGDQYGTAAAKAINDMGVSIYGVLHSPTAGSHDKALGIMNDICESVYESTDTDSFGQAMNKAFTAAYGDNTVVVPVNAADFTIGDIKASAGTATYSNGAIVWNIEGMPFTSHSLTFTMSLTEDNIGQTGSYRLNNGSAHFGDSGATIETNLYLQRTYDPNAENGDNGQGGGDATGETGTQTIPVQTPVTATPTPAPAATPTPAPAATPAPDAVIPDDANPLAAAPTDEGEDATIEDDVNPLAAFDPDVTEADCWAHYPMIVGLLVTLVYGIAVVRRRNAMTNQVLDFENELLGNSQVADAATQSTVAQSPVVR